MIAPFDRPAYVLLRGFVLTTWRYLGIHDTNGREFMRIDWTTDPRCDVHQNAGTGEIAITVRLRGDDPEIAIRRPLRLAGSHLYTAPAGGEPLHPSAINPALLADATDGLIYTHRLFIPLSS